MSSKKRSPTRQRVRRGNEEDAQRFRNDLLNAAFELFSESGLDGVTIRAVATRVGVSPMTPYRYFSDKAELLRGLWEQVLTQLHAELVAASARARDAEARRQALVETLIAFWESHPDEFRLVHQTQSASQLPAGESHPPIPVYGALLALFRSGTEELARAWKLPTDHAKLADDVAFAMALGYLQAAMVNRRYPWSPMPVLRRAMVEQIMLAIRCCLEKGLAVEPG
jgi:AcrR family transcriptional regulator